jgi:hypothetical protein
MGRSDIDTIQTLFLTIQNIHLKGVIGTYGEAGAKKEWVTVTDILRNMPRPKLKQPEIRNFCEYQSSRGNLVKQIGKDTHVRQAEAEYKMSNNGLKILQIYHGDEFSQTRDMMSWSRQQTKEKK